MLVWACCLLAWWIISQTLRNSDLGKVKTRLLGHVKKGAGRDKVKEGPALIHGADHNKDHYVARLLRKLELQDRLQTLIEQAGLKWNVVKFGNMTLAMFGMGTIIGWVSLPGNFRLAAILLGLVLGLLPLLHIIRRRSVRLKKFEELFPDSLEFVARSMRAGHAFSVSLEMIHREFQEPLAGEFRRTFEEHNLGLPLDVALQKLAKRIPSLDVQFFVSAVMLQKRTGGNLAEILDKLAYVIRERFKLRGRIRAISAHGRMTATALSMIPMGVAVLMFMANPDYIRFFFQDEIGNYMMASGIGLQIIGYLIMQKIVQIEV